MISGTRVMGIIGPSLGAALLLVLMPSCIQGVVFVHHSKSVNGTGLKIQFFQCLEDLRERPTDWTIVSLKLYREGSKEPIAWVTKANAIIKSEKIHGICYPDYAEILYTSDDTSSIFVCEVEIYDKAGYVEKSAARYWPRHQALLGEALQWGPEDKRVGPDVTDNEPTEQVSQLQQDMFNNVTKAMNIFGYFLKYKSHKSEDLLHKLGGQINTLLGTRQWTVIQRRTGKEYSMDNTWNQYKEGFETKNVYWMGNDRISILTSIEAYEIMFTFTSKNKAYYARYKSFSIGSQSDKYKLKLGPLVDGNIYDGMNEIRNAPFATKDTKHNKCGKQEKGGWWFKNCFPSCFTCANYRWWDRKKTVIKISYSEMWIRPIA